MTSPTDLQVRHAVAITERNAAESKLAASQSRLSTIDDLTDHCAAQGAYIARQDAELKALRAFVRDVWEECYEATKPDIDAVRETLQDFVGEHGRVCEDCGGDGRVRAETDRFSDQLGHFTSWRFEDCGQCFQGRLPR